MPSFQNNAIDESAFAQFLHSPTAAQLDAFVTALASDENANAFFEEEPPVWAANPLAWVLRRFSAEDWSTDLTEPELVAWDSATVTILSHFDCTESVEVMEHGNVNFEIFELAKKVFNDKSEHQMLQMHPYRFRGLSAAIESSRPQDRLYWPTHALLDEQCLKNLKDDLAAFQDQLIGFQITSPAGHRSIEERRANAVEEASELFCFASRLIDRKAMWFARIDC